MARQTRAATSVADRERLDVAADAIAELLGVEPESIATEPSALRLSLTLSQTERLIALTRSASTASARCAICTCTRPGCRNCAANLAAHPHTVVTGS